MKHCAIVRDLLPMYIEELTSEESGEFIREHLSQCDECRAEYERMTAPTPPPPAPPKWGSWKDACQKEIKKQRRRTIWLVILCLGILWVGIGHVQDYRARNRELPTTVDTPLEPKEVLALCPEVIPTREELDFLTEDFASTFLSDPERVISEEEFAPYRDRMIPPDAKIGEIFAQKQVLTIDYFHQEKRIMLSYEDEDGDGDFDLLRKYVGPYRTNEPPTPFYSAIYSVKTVSTQYEKHEEWADHRETTEFWHYSSDKGYYR